MSDIFFVIKQLGKKKCRTFFFFHHQILGKKNVGHFFFGILHEVHLIPLNLAFSNLLFGPDMMAIFNQVQLLW